MYVQEIPHDRFMIGNSYTLQTYWIHKYIGAKSMMIELTDLFNISVESALVNVNALEADSDPFVRWLDKLEPLTVVFFGPRFCWNKYMYILEHLKSARNVVVHVEPDEIYEKGTLKSHIKNLGIAYGQWIKVRHLLSFKGDFVIQNLTLSEADINKFLHHLKEGSNQNLVESRLAFKNGNDINAILTGLDAVKGRDGWNFALNNRKNCFITYDNGTKKLFVKITQK